MTGVNHDAVERDAVLGERKREFQVLRIGGVIQVHRDRNCGLVGAVRRVQQAWMENLTGALLTRSGRIAAMDLSRTRALWGTSG